MKHTLCVIMFLSAWAACNEPQFQRELHLPLAGFQFHTGFIHTAKSHHL